MLVEKSSESAELESDHGDIDERFGAGGRGRAFDNIFVERLWRTVKYEEVYLKDYLDVPEARQGLGRYFSFYNEQRIHQALAYRTPKDVHFAAR